MQRVWRHLNGRSKDGDRAPNYEDDDHDGRDDHDLQSFAAGFMNALDIFPPKVEGDEDGEGCGKGVLRKVWNGMVRITGDIFYETGQILARRNRADVSGQYVVKEH